jgi:hypothetical protein
VLYVFSYKNCVGAFEQRLPIIAAFRTAIVNLSHYFIRTQEKAENIAKLRNVVLHADSDHRNNAYFRHFFPDTQSLLVLPFAVSNRFTAKTPAIQRSKKCAATGSFHNLEVEAPYVYYRNFIEFFRTDTYHPVRKLLLEHRSELISWLECRISLYREMTNKRRLNARLYTSLGLDVVQADYFSFNIADFYNGHLFAIVGEELSGAPAIGFFEAMACGCVMLGAEGSFYDGLGLRPGVHYLVHSSTIDSIQAAIESASAEPRLLEAIAQAGQNYIEENCRPQKVWDRLQRALAQINSPSTP